MKMSTGKYECHVCTAKNVCSFFVSLPICPNIFISRWANRLFAHGQQSIVLLIRSRFEACYYRTEYE